MTGADSDDTAAWVTDAVGGLAGAETDAADSAPVGVARVDSASAGPDAPASRLAAAEQVWLERCLEWYEIYEGEF